MELKINEIFAVTINPEIGVESGLMSVKGQMKIQLRGFFIRACLRTPRPAHFAEFLFHARRVWEGVPGVRQANGTKHGAKRR
ncbi:hypothetical protein J40TS1_16600 [Paenibacillus montaniterrae]|uniref:Uncharacterized protein n=1 Tax=Paenibacillus montaniterrae TaxID=429341 RepID=A0A919YLD7_9BACL|nr:hypothetical protein J40TS1_16600 [Paenibacillus montaniterrae]